MQQSAPLGDSSQKMRNLYSKWTNIQNTIDRQQSTKNTVLTEKLAFIEASLAEESGKARFIQKQIVKLYEEVSQEEQKRQQGDMNSRRAMEETSEQLRIQVEGLKKGLQECVPEAERQQERQARRIESGESEEKWEKQGEQVKRIQALVTRGMEELAEEESSRHKNQGLLVELISGQVDTFMDSIALERQIREETEHKIASMIEQSRDRLSDLMQEEQAGRENSHNTLLGLLEDTCQKIDMTIKK